MSVNMGGDQPASRGRLSVIFGRPRVDYSAAALDHAACRITAELDEAGNLKLSIAGRAMYAEDAWVGAAIDDHEISEAHHDLVAAALQTVLDACHDDLKLEMEREVMLAAGHLLPDLAAGTRRDDDGEAS